MAGCPCEKRNLDTETETNREDHVKTKAEIGVFHRKPRDTKDCGQPPEAGRGQEGLSPGNFRESMAPKTPGFVTSSLWDCGAIHFPCFKPSSLWHFVIAALGQDYNTQIMTK